jgi:small-conductance mechanosensitive channel
MTSETALNVLWQGAIAAGGAALIFFALVFVRARIRALVAAPRVASLPFGPMLIRTADATHVLFLASAAAFLALPLIPGPEGLISAIQFAFLVAASIQGAIWIREWALALLERQAAAPPAGEETVLSNAMGIVGWLINLAIWSFAFLIILSNLGVDVTALIAGLGIGGIAIGLAAQGIVADLFAALSILFDRPFVKGDFVVIGALTGEIEEIGLKTTRIRALTGEQIVVSNAQLLSRDIHNFRRMNERRTAFKLGLKYETEAETIAQVPDILREIVTAQAGVRFDRAHLTGFGAAALEFEIVYFVQSRSYQRAMDVHQTILLAIMAQFAEMGVELAGRSAPAPATGA